MNDKNNQQTPEKTLNPEKTPITLNYQAIEKKAEENTNEKIKAMFHSSDLKGWFKGSNASLFARIILELELATERMLRSEYLVAGFKAKENWLKEEQVKVKQDIGKYKAGLKLSEGGAVHYFGIFSILEWIFKTGLAFVPIIALMKIN